MICYHWRSEALKNYGWGDCIAVGKTLEEAKTNARMAFEAHLRDRFSFYFGDLQDDYDREALEEKRAAFERDLSAEPETVETALMIEGSD